MVKAGPDGRIPILLDTDPGNDIDDVLAIAYLARQPRCELLGLTTVTGAVDQRAAVAEITLRAAGREDVPIHLGRRAPLGSGPGQPHAAHYAAVQNLPHTLHRPENTAVTFLRDTIRSRPGEITLVTIGPLGNVATLFALDPEIPSLLGGFVSMIGAFGVNDGYEWNAMVDPTAAEIVFCTPRPAHGIIPLDVSWGCRLSPPEIQARFAHPVHAPLRAMAAKWFEQQEEIIFHDPLAVAALFAPGLVEFTAGQVSVHPETGVTTLTGEPGNDHVALQVDPDAFFAEYFAVVNAGL